MAPYLRLGDIAFVSSVAAEPGDHVLIARDGQFSIRCLLAFGPKKSFVVRAEDGTSETVRSPVLGCCRREASVPLMPRAKNKRVRGQGGWNHDLTTSSLYNRSPTRLGSPRAFRRGQCARKGAHNLGIVCTFDTSNTVQNVIFDCLCRVEQL